MPEVEQQQSCFPFRATYREQAQRFHDDHPEVYREFVRLARQARASLDKCGAWLIWGRMRWHFTMERTETYKLNNNYISFYARLAMEQEPDLEGFFETRKASYE